MFRYRSVVCDGLFLAVAFSRVAIDGLVHFRMLQDLQSSLYEENQLRIKLQMEIDSKDSEIEQLTQKLASASADTASNISSGAENDSEEGVQVRHGF